VNAQMFSYNRSWVRKSGIEGNNKRYSVCNVFFIVEVSTFSRGMQRTRLISFLRKD